MKVLWYSDTAMPAVRDKLKIVDLGNRAGWVANASHALSRRDDIELGVVWASSLVEEYTQFKFDNIQYFCVPRGGWMQSISRRLTGRRSIRNIWQALTYLPRQSLRQPLRDCRKIIEQYRPDLIHVHGTENFFGLLGNSIDIPMNVSMQGILVEYAKVYWGSIPWWRRPLFPRELMLHLRMKFNASRERSIIRRNRYFSGRTDWDRDTLLSMNPGAKFYFDGARLLRPEFYRSEWSLDNCSRHRLYTTMTSRPYKGTDTIIEALALIRKKYPTATLHVGGMLSERGYGAYVRRRVRQLGLTDCVNLIGFVEAERIVAELQEAHAYVLGSHIENSPNSVAEAQTVGTPCIATSAGGTPSMVDHEVTGLLYQAGNVAELAQLIDRLFSDDDFARNLGFEERARARERGDVQSNIDTLVAAYRQILEDSTH